MGLSKLFKGLHKSEEETDDSIVYDVVVSNLQPNCDPIRVQKYFEKFGKIQHTKGFTTVAFIKYKNPTSIDRALAHSSENLRRCNYWDQHLYRDNCKGKSEILKLNDDCLFEIFDLLKLEDQVNMAKTCERLKNAFKNKYKIYNDIDLEAVKDEKTLEKILDCLALDIEILTDYNENFRICFRSSMLDLVMNSCRNLTTIGFYKKDVSQAIFDSLTKISKLKELLLIRCLIFDSSLSTLSNFQSLELLNISQSIINSSGQIFPKLQNLKYVNISGCTYIDHNCFMSLCIENPQLISLDMQKCPKLSQTSLYALLYCCKQIQVLKVNDVFVTDEMLKMFTEFKHLSELDISSCESFTTKGLLHFMQNSSKISCLNIKWCRQINKNFLFQVIEFLKNQKQRTECCKIVTTLEKDEKILESLKNEYMMLIEFA